MKVGLAPTVSSSLGRYKATWKNWQRRSISNLEYIGDVILYFSRISFALLVALENSRYFRISSMRRKHLDLPFITLSRRASIPIYT